MGCAGSTAAGGDDVRDATADLASQKLEQELERQQAEENRIVKLLVLGTGESGKSTVFKQMKILYSVPDPPAKFIMICRANLFGNANAVLDGMTRLKIDFKSDTGKAACDKIKSAPTDGHVDNIGDFVGAFMDMYKDAGVKEAIERASEYQLNDSTIYFWERAEELCKPDYLPTEQDVLRARVRTTGIVQQNFAIGEKKYTMFDVGGQRNERRKWIHCFDNVTAVIFVTAISEYDQVLYEDENTNRMDEALILFEQICNHPSFSKTSMILFLNKRDLFEIKLGKKPLSVWRDECAPLGQDYERCIDYLKEQFLKKNKNPETRQVYVHATCATDTNNVSFVMESVFDIILKDNLRKMAKADITQWIDAGGGEGQPSGVSSTNVWATAKTGKIILAACWYTESLTERNVLVQEGGVGKLPAVKMEDGINIEERNWKWVQSLGKNMPDLVMNDKLTGSFKGNFIEAGIALKAQMGLDKASDLGMIYDTLVKMEKGGHPTLVILCIKHCKSKGDITLPGFTWVEHEEFENACYKEFAGVDTDANPCKAPDKGNEFNPFAPQPVGFRWFKGVTLFHKCANNIPDKGVYLGIFKVLSTTSGFKVMVNEHNRMGIPIVFLTESQLTKEETKWMHGVRIREERFNIDLLEGKKPNTGWLGPEMSGEEGATFPEKLWWAIDEAKSRLSTEVLGKLYDRELLFVDEKNNMQLLLFGILAENESDVLPGHIWVARDEFETLSMKFYSPTVLQNLLKETNALVAEYMSLDTTADSMEAMQSLRQKQGVMKDKITAVISSQIPLKWVDRVIMWCADKMPSFGQGIEGANADELVTKALAKNSEIDTNNVQRNALIDKYLKSS